MATKYSTSTGPSVRATHAKLRRSSNCMALEYESGAVLLVMVRRPISFVSVVMPLALVPIECCEESPQPPLEKEEWAEETESLSNVTLLVVVCVLKEDKALAAS